MEGLCLEGNMHSKAQLPLLSLLCVCMSHIPSVPLRSQEGRYGVETEIWAVLVQPTLAPNVDQSQRFLLLLDKQLLSLVDSNTLSIRLLTASLSFPSLVPWDKPPNLGVPQR